ncbi:hypothetical protein BDZ45DRAFT_753731 [Acephala macrosclerotiorum]|nr:hypothetical protein BDZ45DRAFT_753731 [Acephala macrosclerotiorum]
MKGHVVLASVLFALTPFAAADAAEEASQHIDLTKTGNIYSNAQFNIACNGCSIVGDLSFSGGYDDTSSEIPTCIEQRAPNANFSMLPIHIELDIGLTPTQPTNEVIIHLLGDSGLSITFNKGSPYETVYTFDPQIHGWVNSSTPANFTYGLDFTCCMKTKHGHLNYKNVSPCNGSTLTLTAFQSTNSNLQFDLELSFRPLISAKAKFLKGIFSDAITVYGDLPNANLAVSQAMNVINDCTLAPAGTDPAHIYKNLTYVVPSISTDFDLSLAKPKENMPLGPYNGTTLPTQCLDYDSKSTSLIVAPTVRPSSGAVVQLGLRILVRCVAEGLVELGQAYF